MTETVADTQAGHQPITYEAVEGHECVHQHGVGDQAHARNQRPQGDVVGLGSQSP
jgi:hypothetical protein